MDAQSFSLTRASELRAYLKAIDFRPGKSLGQNFLVDANMRDLILDASGAQAGEPVIEIGPGPGVMTEGLLDRSCQVLAIELDHRLCDHLLARFGDREAFSLREEDATRTPWTELGITESRVLSNLPYSVGSRILYDLAEPGRVPRSVTVMLQSDVADRILAQPASDQYGLLTLRLGWSFVPKRIRNVPGNCFWPPPRVGSTVLHLERRETAPAALEDPRRLEALLQFAFTRRRKQIGAIAREGGFPLPGDLDSSRRPETLLLEEWAHWANAT